MSSVLHLARRAPTWATALGVAVTTPLTAYLGTLTIASLLPRRSAPPVDGNLRFAILVPAHDEGAVIGRALKALSELDYPTHDVSVHIVADNCSDDTAVIVRAAGFEAHERDAPDDPGKGAALNWLFDIADSEPKPPDAYVIVDADTTVEPQFLSAMNRALRGEVRAAQGFYGVRDIGESHAAALRYAALACRHHTRALGRTRLGASCGLYGNGMAFRRSVLQGRRWSGHLVEDAEFQMELLLDGQLVTYVPEARLHAEMPDTLVGSGTQNSRWERGRLDLLRRYVPALMARAARSGHRRIATVDAVMDHLVPPLSVLALAQTGTSTASLVLRLLAPKPRNRTLWRLAATSTVMLVGHVVLALVSVRAPRAVYRSLLGAPRAVLWKTRLWARVLVRNDVPWVRTERNTRGGCAEENASADPPTHVGDNR